MWESILKMLAANGGASAAPGLAGALGGAVPSVPSPSAVPVGGAVPPFAAPGAPAMGTGMYGVESLGNAIGGIAPAVHGSYTPAISGGPTTLGPVAQGTGPLLATEQNVEKLAMAPIDPAKLMQLMAGQGQGQQRSAGNPGSPAQGRSLEKRQGVRTAAVKRPGALGG